MSPKVKSHSMITRSRKKNVPSKSEKLASKTITRKRKRSERNIVEKVPKNEQRIRPLPSHLRLRRRMAGYADLPEKIILMIFSKLTTINDVISCGRVCSSWHQTSKHESLWNRITLNVKYLEPYEFHNIVKNLPPSVSYLKINGSITNGLVLNKEVVSVLEKKCPNLGVLLVEDFMLMAYYQDHFDLQYLPSSVSIISLRRCVVHSDGIWRWNSIGSESITVVNLSFSRFITSQHLLWFNKMVNLTQLYLAGCSVGDNGVEYLSKRSVCYPFRRLKLKVLDLEATNITDVSLIDINKLIFIEKLYLGRTNIEFSNYRYLVEEQSVEENMPFPALTDLCLINTPIDNIMLCALAKLRSMKHLNVVSNGSIKHEIRNLSEKFKKRFIFHDQKPSQYCMHFDSDHVF